MEVESWSQPKKTGRPDKVITCNQKSSEDWPRTQEWKGGGQGIEDSRVSIAINVTYN